MGLGGGFLEPKLVGECIVLDFLDKHMNKSSTIRALP
jgi:hypothetical protein